MIEFKRTAIKFAAILLTVSIISACDNNDGSAGNEPLPPLTIEDIAQKLESAGAAMEVGEIICCLTDFYGVESQALIIEEERLQVIVYPSTEDLDAFRDRLSPDGSSITIHDSDGFTVQGMTVDWTSRPRFFSLENVVILYVGSDEDIVLFLTDQFGPPFAPQDYVSNGTMGTVSGLVLDSDGNPLANIEVNIAGQITLTDLDGVYFSETVVAENSPSADGSIKGNALVVSVKAPSGYKDAARIILPEDQIDGSPADQAPLEIFIDGFLAVPDPVCLKAIETIEVYESSSGDCEE